MSKFVVNHIEGVVLVTLNKIPNNSHAIYDIFEAFQQINVDMICQTAPYKDHINLSFTIDEGDLPATMAAIGGIKEKIAGSGLVTEINPGNCKFTIFSECLKTESGVAAKLFRCLSEGDLQSKLITTSDVEISVLFDQADNEKAEEILKAEFN